MHAVGTTNSNHNMQKSYWFRHRIGTGPDPQGSVPEQNLAEQVWTGTYLVVDWSFQVLVGMYLYLTPFCQISGRYRSGMHNLPRTEKIGKIAENWSLTFIGHPRFWLSASNSHYVMYVGLLCTKTAECFRIPFQQIYDNIANTMVYMIKLDTRFIPE